ncbi:MAG: ABC transporter transmembrane domain-containing protein [Defluviitaleaceae bacterium]|nr:ABC transporter transmembrane domain-containing protein [Defluviitaleaceae bacterium]
MINVFLILLDLTFAENSRVLFDLAPNIAESDAMRIIITFLVVVTAQLLLNLVHPLLFSHLNESVVYAMRQKLLTRLQHLPLKYYDENHSSKIHNLYFD